MTTPETLRFYRSSHVAWRRIGDEPVVVNLASKRLFGLNSSGGSLWEALEGGASIAELAALLSSGPAPGEPERAVAEFLAVLASHDLVEGRPDHCPPAAGPVAAGGLCEAPAVMWSELISHSIQYSPGPSPNQPATCGY